MHLDGTYAGEGAKLMEGRGPPGDAERAHDLVHGVRVERELGLDDGPPQLQPVLDALEHLHVEPAVAHLHRRVGPLREQVELVALGDLAGRRVEVGLGAPLPAEARHASWSCFAKKRSALRVFVSCSPLRSTPRSSRNARVSAATWNGSLGLHFVESSRIRDPSG